MKVCVVGAGVIGLTTAYALARKGCDVTVVDACNGVGLGTSYANGAQLSYSYVAPLADASVWKSLPGYLLDPRSPLSFRPRLDPDQWSWIIRFLRACNAKSSSKATADLLALAFFSRACIEEWQDKLRLEFGFRTAGKLVMLSSKAAISAAHRQVALQASLGCRQQVLSTDRCIDIEPSLAPSRSRWEGGVYTPSEQVGDCASFCVELARVLKDRHAVRFMLNTKVTGAIPGNHGIHALRSNAGDIAADSFVIANGVGAVSLGKRLGCRMPIYPLKGYSVTLQAARSPDDLPSVSITDLAKKVVYARVGNQLRVAGRAEIVGNDLTVAQARCVELAQEAESLFSTKPSTLGDIAPWAGLRPATPTGIPIIGQGPAKNLFVNAGHGALGWTLACGSAELIARQMTNEQSPIDPTPFRFRK